MSVKNFLEEKPDEDLDRPEQVVFEILEPITHQSPAQTRNIGIGDCDIEDYVEQVEDDYGIDISRAFDEVKFEELDPTVLGQTRYEEHEGWTAGRNDLDSFTQMALHDDITELPERDIYHTIAHEYVHGAYFNGFLGEELRDRGFSTGQTMYLLDQLESGKEERVEGATEYIARMMDPNKSMRKDVLSYQDEFRETVEEMEEKGINPEYERRQMIEGQSSYPVEVNEVRYEDGFLVEYGKAEEEYLGLEEGEEYLRVLGEDVEEEDLGKFLDKENEDDDDYDPDKLYIQDLPYDQDTGEYEEIPEFESGIDLGDYNEPSAGLTGKGTVAPATV